MRRSGLSRLAVIASLFLAASAFGGCCKRYVTVHVPPCPGIDEEALVQLYQLDEAGDHDALVTYMADKILPYCDGIAAMNEE